jgi:uncharacterized protein
MKKVFIRSLLVLSILVVLGYSAIIIYLLTQETNLVFYENYKKPVHVGIPDFENLDCQPVIFKSEDRIKLTGWILHSNPDTIHSPWLLFFHGNASDISFGDYIERYKILTGMGFNVLCFDYRGFGESEGEPSESGIYKDASASYQYLVNNLHISPIRIIIYGHSLGAAIAIELASRYPAAGLVVEAGFQSIPETAHQLYPFLPMRLIVKNKFLSIDKIDHIAYPKLFIHSSDDQVIPISDGKALFAKALQPKQFLTLKGSHDSAPIQSKKSYVDGLTSFFRQTSNY